MFNLPGCRAPYILKARTGPAIFLTGHHRSRLHRMGTVRVSFPLVKYFASSRQRKNRPLQVLLHPVPAVAAFSARSKEDGDYDSSAVLKLPRTSHVSLVDETRRTYRPHGRQRGAPRRINVPPRDAARRTTSLRNARAAGDVLAALARLARTVTLKRLWLRDRLRATAVQRAADEIEFALRNAPWRRRFALRRNVKPPHCALSNVG